MNHTFVVSDESVNKYGFRVLTNGIDTSQFEQNPVMYYMHRRNIENPTGGEVIGRWENIRVKNGKLLADAVFDESEPLGKKIAGKVKNGFIKMASIGIERKETSAKPTLLLDGQTKPTVTKSLLQEISIVDQGGNNNALKLYGGDGDEIELELLNQKNDMSNLKAIALALGLEATAEEAAILVAATQLKTAKNAAEVKLANFEKAKKEAQKIEAETLIDKGVTLGLIPEGMKETYHTLFAQDHLSTRSAVESLIASSDSGNGKSDQLGDFMKNVGGGKKTTDAPKTFDWLQKNDTAQLADIRKNQPEVYQQLVNDYTNGVREKI